MFFFSLAPSTFLWLNKNHSWLKNQLTHTYLVSFFFFVRDKAHHNSGAFFFWNVISRSKLMQFLTFKESIAFLIRLIICLFVCDKYAALSYILYE